MATPFAPTASRTCLGNRWSGVTYWRNIKWLNSWGKSYKVKVPTSTLKKVKPNAAHCITISMYFCWAYDWDIPCNIAVSSHALMRQLWYSLPSVSSIAQLCHDEHAEFVPQWRLVSDRHQWSQASSTSCWACQCSSLSASSGSRSPAVMPSQDCWFDP